MYLPARLLSLPLTILSLLAVHAPHTFASDHAPVHSSALSPIFIPGDQTVLQPVLEQRPLEFSLRYIFHHGTHKYPNLHRRLNITNHESLQVYAENGRSTYPASMLQVKSKSLRIERLADRSQENIDYILDTGRTRGTPMALDASAWTVDDVPGPNVTDKESVLSIARMAANAYVLDDQETDWLDIGNGFNYTEDFGWKNDGLRGHIFADTENKTVVIAIKGTTAAVFDGSGTTTNDKINDNLFFSCCCGQGGRYGWLQVCDCQTSAFQCNSTCVVEALRNKNRYYYAAQEIYRNVTEIYPDADIWLAGHSLGGATSSLVALTYGLPVVTFEAPGEAMAAKRLGLPTPPGYHLGAHQQRASTGGFHFGHTADPIFMGTCNTYSSVCTIAGYAMQSVCHTGETCTFDTVGDLGWRSGAGTHRIQSVIHDVLEKYPEPAKCAPMTDCSDCFNWEFYESHNKTSSTSSSSSTTTTLTSTSTCKTPGWWGCLDESTTTTTRTTTSTTSTTCKKGWFGGGCDETTTTSTATTDTATLPNGHSPTSTSHCISKGWFGQCRDPTQTPAPRQAVTSPVPIQTSPYRAAATSCTSVDWFGVVCSPVPDLFQAPVIPQVRRPPVPRPVPAPPRAPVVPEPPVAPVVVPVPPQVTGQVERKKNNVKMEM